MSDLENAKPGDIFVRGGTEWEVIGIDYAPSVILQRVGLWHLTTDEHTRQSVIPTSLWAREWTRKQPPVDPVLELARKLVADRYGGSGADEFVAATLAGEDDDTVPVQNAVKAIRAGMALARES